MENRSTVDNTTNMAAVSASVNDDHQLSIRRRNAEFLVNGLFERWPKIYFFIVFSDEAHLWLNGYVNKQNCRFWSEDQPEELQNAS